MLELAVESPEILDIPVLASVKKIVEIVTEPTAEVAPKTPQISTTETKVSALSLASIRAKRELQETNKSHTKESVQLPSEPFTETDMLLHWNKYAQKLGDKGSEGS